MRIRKFFISSAVVLLISVNSFVPSMAMADTGPVVVQNGKIKNIDSIEDIYNLGNAPYKKITLKNGENAVVDTSLVREGQISVVGNNFAELSWDYDGNYEVYRNDEKIDEVKGTSYRDNLIKPGEQYNYKLIIVADDVKTDEEAPQILGFTVNTLGENGNVKFNKLKINESLKQSINTWTTVYYKTFIPLKYIDAPLAGCGSYSSVNGNKFGGDDRDFQADYGSSRTTMGATIAWNNFATIHHSSWTQPTHVYDKNGNLLATAQADSSGLKIERLYAGNDYVNIKFVANAANPFCNSTPGFAGIYGEFTIKVSKTGAYQIANGKHRQMPNHEIYIKGSSNGNWVTFYRRKYLDLSCLVDIACSYAVINAKGNY